MKICQGRNLKCLKPDRFGRFEDGQWQRLVTTCRSHGGAKLYLSQLGAGLHNALSWT